MKLSSKTLLAIAVSALWFVLAIVGERGQNESWGKTFGLALGPIIFLWGLAWIGKLVRTRRERLAKDAPIDRTKGARTRELAGLVLLIAGILSVAYVAGSSNNVIDVLFKVYIPLTLLAWVIWRLALDQLPGGLLLTAGIVYALWGAQYSWRSNQAAVDERNYLSSGIALIRKASVGQEVSGKDIADAHAGRYEPLLVFAVKYAKMNAAIQVRFNEAVKGLQLDEALSASTLAVDSQREAAEARIRSLKAAIKSMGDESERVHGMLVAEGKASNIPAALLEKFDVQMKAKRELLRIEASIASEADDLMAYMRMRRGKYGLKDGKLMFRTQEDLDGFKKRMSSIAALAAQEQSWMAEHNRPQGKNHLGQ